MSEADLRWAVLYRANISESDLGWADLSESNLDAADFHYCTFGGTIVGNTDLSAVTGLETTKHHSPSIIGIDTIYMSKGNTSEVFLRSAGVPENFITFMNSLTGKAFDFHSCFISYSSKDEDFAKRLHADLQSKGVRVWFAPEDLKIGDKFRTRIDEAIRAYDKLLIVLSENSIHSTWVEKEVEAAFEKEQRQKRTMFFPVRLDDAVMQTNQAWAADIRRQRHIGDMKRWKEHDHYQAGFDRLLRDLQAEESNAS